MYAPRIAAIGVTMACLAACLAGCEPNRAELAVDLRTDLTPGRDFALIRTRYAPEAPPTEGSRTVETQPPPSGSLAEGVRVAEFSALLPGTSFVRVTLLDAAGEEVLSRLVKFASDGDYGLTVVITRSCHGVSCAEELTCVGGQCDDPACSAVNPQACEFIECSRDDECPSPGSCAQARCVLGECMALPDDSLCGTREICDVEQGCSPEPTGDGGVCMVAETDLCDNRIDDDCDRLIDCDDPDCAEAGPCLCGTSCDDNNPCTDDRCDETQGCVHTPNSASCDDGSWCNGTDRCSNGSCSVHSGSPCPQECRESTRTCEECLTANDCGSVTFTTWSLCSFSSTCDEAGSRKRTKRTPVCSSGRCQVNETVETDSCSRNTDGRTCGTSSTGSWSSCKYSNSCDETGSRTRTITEKVCKSGSCGTDTRTESDSCSRDTEHDQCGSSTRYRCCSGGCRDTFTDERHCGACGQSCASGLTCGGLSGGGHSGASCGNCSANSQCPPSSATCWIAGGSRCQCQANSHCGSVARCYDGPGNNFCYYP